MYKKCKYIYTCNTYGRKTSTTALIKEIYESNSFTQKKTNLFPCVKKGRKM